MKIDAQLVLDARASLGEGSYWDRRSGRLYWVDIEGRSVHLFDPGTGKDTKHPTEGRPGTLVPRERDGIVVAAEDRVLVYDRVGGEARELCRFASEPPGNRLNDGKCDPAGRLWVGSMSTNREPRGTLYRVETDGAYAAVVTGVTISNGIVWTDDERTMYYIDTPTQTVRAFDYTVSDGSIAGSRTAFVVPEAMGHPDGMAIDAQGMLWIAMFGGSAVRRFDPSDGSLLATVELPASNVTSCAFGGDDLRDLYVTTARIGLSDEAATDQPLAGGLFHARVDVPGLPTHLFAG